MWLKTIHIFGFYFFVLHKDVRAAIVIGMCLDPSITSSSMTNQSRPPLQSWGHTKQAKCPYSNVTFVTWWHLPQEQPMAITKEPPSSQNEWRRRDPPKTVKDSCGQINSISVSSCPSFLPPCPCPSLRASQWTCVLVFTVYYEWSICGHYFSSPLQHPERLPHHHRFTEELGDLLQSQS